MLPKVLSWREQAEPLPVEDGRPDGKVSDLEPPVDTPKRRKDDRRGIALALGGGAARGWAHIGVIRALDEANVPISMIAGTSIGALVGGCYLAGKLDELEHFARSLTRRGMFRFLDFQMGGSGLIRGMRLSNRLTQSLEGFKVESLSKPFIAVATDARSGHEIWIDSGPLVLAMRASYALPGVFEPVDCAGRRLLDGALVNPVPANVCRTMEERLVVAVNLHHDLYGRAAVVRLAACEDRDDAPSEQVDRRNREMAARRENFGVIRSMVDAFNIIQDRISRSRLAGDPPDLTVSPRVRDIGLSEFHRAGEAIEIGYEAATARISEIRQIAEEVASLRG
ncbi:patatin-like phospholipase family protein [Fulvimarina sp. 2208YS6-2-32]|uniref:Patatin-like phospholipase family protein n=1 Tax=Fulvimarina uroteuthidis TaxID=3098149 RepID=A0ABU5I783_9HYPH|nr:patatin-like phospholipase family protein [Fulvimarina sp. 2208YS6-2-32]MDY8110982.1 patatin-like phospholipase family protein [Fulvimarina sp. 2208YS6-2-32]